jgi:threonine dehydrogenase-like Zn-dependent dehydrogenase
MAAENGKAEIIDFSKVKIYDQLQELTRGRGPDRCIDAVGAEAHAWGSFDSVVDAAKATVGLGTDRPHVVREAMMCCRKGGTISMPGVYFGYLDKIPFGAFVNKALTLKVGQTHVHRYLKPLMEEIQKGTINPAGIITHRAPLSAAPELYKKFRDKEYGCVKVVLTP